MKLDISSLEATILGFSFSSFFVLSLYIWIPFERIFNKDKDKERKVKYDENSKTEILKRIISVIKSY